MLPKLFQMLLADITNHEDFSKLICLVAHKTPLCSVLADRILQMFFLGVVESYPISTTVSLVNKFVEMVCRHIYTYALWQIII